MKKLILIQIVLSVIIYTKASAQQTETDADTLKNMLLRDFSKVDPKNYIDLIPFKKDGKWGYVHRKTKKVVILPKYDDLSFFKPGMYGYYQGETFFIDKEGNIKIKKDENENEGVIMEEVAHDKEFEGIEIISSKNGYKGFKTDREGKLIAYSDLYHSYSSGFTTWNVNPFKIKDKTYAIAIQKASGKYGVIDSLGNVMKGFDFTYKSILHNKYSKDEKNTWFFVEGENNCWSLINDKGVYKLQDKIIDYPITSGMKLGYGALRKKDLSGIFDYYNMDWVIAPQDKIKIGTIDYSSAVILDIENSKDREKAVIYYSVFEDNSIDYIDLKGNKYLPKNESK